MKRPLHFIRLLDKVSFKQIFLFWVGYMFIFGIFYYLLSFADGQGVLYHGAPLGNGMSGFVTAEYFSFITAASASQGYGDVFPHGASRALAVIEAVSGLVIFGAIISKLLSQKQETLLQEVYDISFDEKINRIRSAFYLFRTDVNKIVDKIENNAISQRRIDDLWLTFSTLENTMYMVTKMLQPRTANHYVKQIDDLGLELVLSSLSMSLAKACDLFEILDERNFRWRNDTLNSIIVALSVSVDGIQNHLKHRELNKNVLDKVNDVATLAEKMKERAQVTVSFAAA